MIQGEIQGAKNIFLYMKQVHDPLIGIKNKLLCVLLCFF